MKYKDWKSLNEANFFDKIKNFLSGAFGGSITKLDSLSEEYRNSEMDYVDEWEKTQEEIDKLELERSQIKSDPAEIKKIDRLLIRNNQFIKAQAKAHEKKTEQIFDKVRKIITDNKRLRTYWEKIKSDVDAEVSEDMYKKAKDMADDSLADSLYTKYKNAVLNAKKKDEEFREKYGNLMTKEIQYSTKKIAKDPDDSDFLASDIEHSGSSFSNLIDLSISDFANIVKNLPSKQAKSLLSYLTKQRNEKYVALDLERDNLNRYVEKSTNKDKARDVASEKIKDLRSKYMGEIRDLRSKITVVKKYA
jgi:hypothetical protein